VKLTNTILSCIFLIAFSSHVSALGISPWTTVTQIIQGPASYPLITIADPGDAGTGCSSTGRLRFNDVDNSVAGKRHFSTILSALAAGKEIRIRTSACSSDYPYIEYVYIRS
jgi:hypothetical protein